ncbi:hypothetical protein [Chryseolinea sp. H1M3-3]|uniref:hypothetical protein n=1 Tax=Chryseolinea sp. H1M3-3 TaxID=3034144 RepID=UPI0023ED771F|nr:hypothetical protein [Chryseolinea sp. H1M3-3]
MELRDIIVTPLLIIIIFTVAYIIRPRVTDEITRKYFIPALFVKIVGALAVGIIYQFYYGGGDTFNYHTHGSRHIWEAFTDSPIKGLRLLTNDGKTYTDIYKYSSKIIFFSDPQSFAIVKIAAIFDLITFSAYSSTAILFAIFSFIGMWMFFLTFYEQYPQLHRWLAIAAFFIPSVFFWGSGLLKDTVTMGCLGIATYQVYRILIKKKFGIRHILLLALALYGIYSIKIYIILTFLPAAIVWVFLANLDAIRSPVLKIMLAPFMISCAIALGYIAMLKAGEDHAKYSLENVAMTAKITAYDIGFYTGRDAGSGYSLGELDGTFGSMVRLAPQAVNVSLFRPYLWEVKNPFMLLSALESACLLGLSLYIIFKKNIGLPQGLTNPNVVFALVFSVAFAFAVGVSTFNFGTLVRYKIPLLPFFVVALILIWHHSNRDKKLPVLESTE